MTTQEHFQTLESQYRSSVEDLLATIQGHLYDRDEFDQCPSSLTHFSINTGSFERNINLEGDTVRITWTEDPGGCSCCDNRKYHCLTFPKSHLWDPAWKDQLRSELEEAKRVQAETLRLGEEQKQTKKAEQDKAKLHELLARYPEEASTQK